MIFDYTALEEKGFNRFEIIFIFFSAADPGLMPEVLKGLSVSRRTLLTPIYTGAGEKRLQLFRKKFEVCCLWFVVEGSKFKVAGWGCCRHMALGE